MIFNLTPHEIAINGILIQPCGCVARCTERTINVGDFHGIPLVLRDYGEVEDLPEPEPDTLLIVSHMVRTAQPDRTDLASPGDLIRDADGRIIGCKNLVVNPGPPGKFETP